TGFSAQNKGWGAELSQAYARKLDVYNRGFSGYNTEWAKELLAQLLPKEQSQYPNGPKIVLMTIFFGANDSVMESFNQRVELDRYKENLIQMVNMVKHPNSQSPDHFQTRVILITPPPLDEEAWRIARGNVLDRKSDLTRQYALACVQVAQELDVPVILFKELMRVILANWPELDPAKLPLIQPDWQDVNVECDKKIFEFNGEFIYNRFK
ncbi:2490_t:CDS:2, partial [Acaulospora colombiana]